MVHSSVTFIHSHPLQYKYIETRNTKEQENYKYFCTIVINIHNYHKDFHFSTSIGYSRLVALNTCTINTFLNNVLQIDELIYNFIQDNEFLNVEANDNWDPTKKKKEKASK